MSAKKVQKAHAQVISDGSLLTIADPEHISFLAEAVPGQAWNPPLAKAQEKLL
jgi:hypothetical protein